MKINEFFSKGYYINLDRRPDRKEQFEQEMELYGLGGFCERFAALDSINEPDSIKKHYYCAQSFFNLYKKIYDEGYENVVIFEDDAYFYNGPNELPGITLCENALDELKDFDGIIVPGGFGKRGVEGKVKAINYVRENNIPFLYFC